MDDTAQKRLVETDWLASHLHTPGLVVLDGSMHLPTAKRDAKAEYRAQHIPGALFFDIDDIADETSPLPHMLPPTPKFASRMKKMGIGDGMHVVAYDSEGLYSAARVWWMFRAMGHRNVAVLDGGLPKWLKEGRQTVGTATQPTERHFTARFNAGLVRDLMQVKSALERNSEQVVDARSAGRFRGVDPEPRAGLRGGHMPGALNVPFADLLDPVQKTFLPADMLAARFTAAGVDLGKPIVTSCGSGVTACVLALGLYLLGCEDAAVYDGSWTEWGGRKDTPVETD